MGIILDDEHVNMDEDHPAVLWAAYLRESLAAMHSGKPITDTKCMKAPRRRHADSANAVLAAEIAQLLYPAPLDSAIGPVIKYDKDIVLLRKAVIAQEDALLQEATRKRAHWRTRILDQGPWDETGDPWNGVISAQPMPVDISGRDSLLQIFHHLSVGTKMAPLAEISVSPIGKEPYDGIQTVEFEKGIVYADGRLDLCKKVLGPQNIVALMKSLESNHFIRHFLLGNNVVGPVGARAITEFVTKLPERIETWYLAGNCVNSDGLNLLVAAWCKSKIITNIWLKRNPLGTKSISDLSKLILCLPNLRTLDLDMTELGDEGTAVLLRTLEGTATHQLPLRNLYLNAVGISKAACKAMAAFLRSPACGLESLYISDNPIGDLGAVDLAEGLRHNDTLLRLSIRSSGLKSDGAAAIFDALSAHPKLKSINVGQGYATDDIGSRYNFISDTAVPSLQTLIRKCNSLRMLNLGTTAMTPSCIDTVLESITANPSSLVVVVMDSVYSKLDRKQKASLRVYLERNILRLYPEMSVEQFQSEERRWLISPKDVRYIDSAYRNRDTDLARRGLITLKKWWEVGDDWDSFEKGVMEADYETAIEEAMGDEVEVEKEG